MPTIDGIVSGLDTTALIESILAAQSVAIDTLEQQKADAESQLEGVSGVKNRLVALSDAIKAMDTPEELQVFTASSDSDQFDIFAEEGASPGTYSIQVNQLASAQISVSDGYDDADAAVLGTGTFSVTIDGTTTDITIDSSNNSLSGLAEELNAVVGLSAYVIDTGGSPGRYRLLVQGLSTGADNAFTLDGSALGTGTNPTFTINTTAMDAEVEIAGVTIHVASNTLNGAIPGIRVELKGVGASPDTAVVSNDSAGTRAKLQAVVDAYNAVVEYYDQQTVYNPDENIKGGLVGESTTRRAVSGVGDLFSDYYTVAGVDLESLSQLGVSTGQDGKISLDADAFDEAYEADSDAVTTFLTDASGPLVKIAAQIDDLYVDDLEGSLSSREDTIEGTIEDYAERITEAEEKYTASAEILRNQFEAMELALAELEASAGYLSALFASIGTTTTSSQS